MKGLNWIDALKLAIYPKTQKLSRAMDDKMTFARASRKHIISCATTHKRRADCVREGEEEEELNLTKVHVWIIMCFSSSHHQYISPHLFTDGKNRWSRPRSHNTRYDDCGQRFFSHERAKVKILFVLFVLNSFFVLLRLWWTFSGHTLKDVEKYDDHVAQNVQILEKPSLIARKFSITISDAFMATLYNVS